MTLVGKEEDYGIQPISIYKIYIGTEGDHTSFNRGRPYKFYNLYIILGKRETIQPIHILGKREIIQPIHIIILGKR